MTGARVGEADHPGPEGEAAPPPPPPARPLPWELWSVPIPHIDDQGKLNFELAEPGMEDIVRNELRGVAMEDVDFELLMQECEMAAGWGGQRLMRGRLDGERGNGRSRRLISLAAGFAFP